MGDNQAEKVGGPWFVDPLYTALEWQMANNKKSCNCSPLYPDKAIATPNESEHSNRVTIGHKGFVALTKTRECDTQGYTAIQQ